MIKILRLSVYILIILFSVKLSAQIKVSDYVSPYSVKYTFTEKELINDILHGERGEIKNESSIPFSEWYTEHTKAKYGAWGAPQKHYAPLEDYNKKSVEWKRERLIANAVRFIGYDYQHHYIPDWDPPEIWPYLKSPSGHNGKGLDCSNLTSFIYSQSFGIHLNSAIKTQSEETEIEFFGTEKKFEVKVIEKPETFDELVKELKTGDLLYIKGTEKGEVTHVIIWVGTVGVSPDNTLLVLDSTGDDHVDSNGKKIPTGIHLRPFNVYAWYYKCFSHAHRIIQD